MKKFLAVIAAVVVGAVCANAQDSGWMPSRGQSFTGLTWTITASNMPLKIRSIHFSYQSNQVSTVTLYRTEGTTNYVLNVATGSFKDVWVTPSGNGTLSIPLGQSLKILQVLTNEAAVIVDTVDPRKPE